MIFRAVSPPSGAPADSYKAPAVRAAESFLAAHRMCQACDRRPSAIVMTRADGRAVAVCRPCGGAPSDAPRRDDGAADRARRERAAQLMAAVRRQGLC